MRVFNDRGADPDRSPANLMADINIHDWLFRLNRNGPALVSSALGVLIVIELARGAAALVGINSPPSLRPAPAPSRVRAIHEGVEVARIVSAHLFGNADPEAVQDPANAPRSAANLALSGTIATQNPKQGMAIIGDPGQFKVYSVGQLIAGASLHSVYLDHVILDRNGFLETLALPRPNVGADPSVGRAAARSSVARARPTAPPQEQDTPFVQKVAESGEETDVQGNMIGIRVTPGADRSTFVRSGLIGGDVIVAVNGTKLDAERGQDLWNQVSTGTTVTVIRRGKTQDVTLNFAP